MSYREYLPHPALHNYIDAYWTIKTSDLLQSKLYRILPDGCTDIIFNRGSTIYKPGQQQGMLAGESYLIGTMTTFTETVQSSGNSLLGIRFKPGAIGAFHHLDLQEITNLAVPYRNDVLKELIYRSLDLLTDLNLYFLNRLPLQPPAIAIVMAELHNSKGLTKVSGLTKTHNMSERKLERLFKKDTGVSIKGMTRLIRFTHAVKAIQSNSSGHNLARIAYASGYYDQAHLCNEIKAYTGLTPGQL
jgi:AraC-like DNA-binding protein